MYVWLEAKISRWISSCGTDITGGTRLKTLRHRRLQEQPSQARRRSRCGAAGDTVERQAAHGGSGAPCRTLSLSQKTSGKKARTEHKLWPECHRLAERTGPGQRLRAQHEQQHGGNAPSEGLVPALVRLPGLLTAAPSTPGLFLPPGTGCRQRAWLWNPQWQVNSFRGIFRHDTKTSSLAIQCFFPFTSSEAEIRFLLLFQVFGGKAMVPPLIFISHLVYSFNLLVVSLAHLILKVSLAHLILNVTIADFNMKMKINSGSASNNSTPDATARELIQS